MRPFGHRRTSALLLAGPLVLWTAGTVHAADPAAPKTPCNVEAVKADVAKNQPGVLPALKGMVRSTSCSALVNLLRQIAGGRVVAGRKLEAGRAPPAGAAESELTQARADPAIQAELAAELEGETDEARKLLLEAVVMGDNGKLLARDLLLEQLVARGRP